MTSLIGILSFLAALAATSYALSCTECISVSSSTCSGISKTCPPGFQCGSLYTETSQAGMTAAALVRSCTPLSECNAKGSIGLQGGHTRMVTSCCNTDDCTPTIPPVSTNSLSPNGLVCQSCLSANSDWCSSSETMQCMGDEDMCLLQTTKVTGPITSSAAIRGCASKSICDLGSQSSKVGDTSTEVKFLCTSDGISVHKVILTPAIMCLLLLKLFF